MARLAAGLSATVLPRLDFHQQDSIKRFHLLVFEILLSQALLGAIATILLQNGLLGEGNHSIVCTTHKAKTRFGFKYLRFMGLYSKSPELAFNQWVAGSSPARLMAKHK